MTVNKDEIRNALEDVTPWPWIVGEDDKGNAVTVDECLEKSDVRLIVNAPEWLRSLLASDDAKEETIRQLRRDNTALRECLEWIDGYRESYLPASAEPYQFAEAFLAVEDRVSDLLARLDRKDTQPQTLCPNCRRGMIHCGVCSESEYDRYHGLEDTQGEGGQT